MVSNQFDIRKYEQIEFAISDHDIVEVQLQYKPTWTNGKGIWKNNPIVYKNENFFNQFK